MAVYITIMKIVASIEVKNMTDDMIDSVRLVHELKDRIVKSIINEKNLVLADDPSREKEDVIRLVKLYDSVIDSVDVRMWGKVAEKWKNK